MTAIQSVSGTRIDCDRCEHHTGTRAQSIVDLRHTTGYVNHHGRDLCPTCWTSLTDESNGADSRWRAPDA